MADELNEFETPFGDATITREEPSRESVDNFFLGFMPDQESPFSRTYELPDSGGTVSPHAGEFVQFLGELNDREFSDNLYELAAELEDTWNSKISNEIAMGDKFVPFANYQAAEYFAPLIRASENMIDQVSQQFSGNNPGDLSETEIDKFFNEILSGPPNLSPAQEQFFGSLLNKVKSVVKKGINIVGKFMPVNIILNKLKGLVRPLLDKVLKFAIGKLPQNLQGPAQILAKKFLNLETYSAGISQEAVPSTGELEALQTELDNHIASLVFSSNESEADNLVMEYESSTEGTHNYESEGLNLPSLEAARQQFINELGNLQSGESPAPAIERFLPVVIYALKPVIRAAISIIGRQKIINFLAGLLAKLVGSYVPENVAKPLASSIIDVGLKTIGFETFEMNKSDLAYETIANTIQETIQNMEDLTEENLDDQEALSLNLLEAFETAAANNFPSQYIREEFRPSGKNGVWVHRPRGSRHRYKKYTHVFDAVIDPQTSSSLTTFRGLPLSAFLRDRLGLDISKPIHARVHLFEAIPGTRLSQISKHERIPGLGAQPFSWIQLHPLSEQAAALLLKEPALGKDFPVKFTSKRSHIAVGQRFYFLEIEGARLRMNKTTSGNQPGKATGSVKPAETGDISAVINFVKSEIRINYYFSEEEAKSVVAKLNQNDLGASALIRNSVKNILHGILLDNMTDRVKIIHESLPEMYLENYEDEQESNISLGTGKKMITGLLESLVEKISGLAYEEVRDCFKSRAAEFKQAQSDPQDGVTLKIIWENIPGMISLKAAISAIRRNQFPSNMGQLTIPGIPKPVIKIMAGKHLD